MLCGSVSSCDNHYISSPPHAAESSVILDPSSLKCRLSGSNCLTIVNIADLLRQSPGQPACSATILGFALLCLPQIAFWPSTSVVPWSRFLPPFFQSTGTNQGQYIRDELALILVATKDSGPHKKHELCLSRAELGRWHSCARRYWLTIHPSNDTGRQRESGIVEASRLLGEFVAAEHEICHSTMLSIPYGYEPDDSGLGISELNLHASGCFACSECSPHTRIGDEYLQRASGQIQTGLRRSICHI